MNRRRRSEQARGQGTSGFVLIEVMVAVILATILLVPLSGSMHRAIDAARGVEEKLAEAGGTGVPGSNWNWGPMVNEVGWKPGPELEVLAQGAAGDDLSVGIWAEGWSLGEWPADVNGEVRVSSESWSDDCGKELVIRARAGQGPWGPPWRTMVPDALARASGGSCLTMREADMPEVSPAEARPVVHVRSFSSAAVSVCGSAVPTGDCLLGLVFVLPQCSEGCCAAEVGSRLQSWRAAEDRVLDAYF